MGGVTIHHHHKHQQRVIIIVQLTLIMCIGSRSDKLSRTRVVQLDKRLFQVVDSGVCLPIKMYLIAMVLT